MAASAPALAQTFTAGNLVVAVEGQGVHGALSGPYTDNQAGPLTLFQYAPSGTTSATYVDSLVLPQTASGANGPVSGEYGSSSEATLQLSGDGYHLAIMGYGVNAADFNSDPGSYSPDAGNAALGQSGSLTGQSYTAVPRVVALIDAFGNIDSSTAIFNVYDTNNPRSAYTADGTNIYISGQGTGSDATGGVFYTKLGSSSATAITGLDTSSNTAAQDTRTVQIYSNTLYVSVDSKEGSGSNRDFIGTLGSPPATSLYMSGAGPTQIPGFGTSTGKVTITSGVNSNGNGLNAGKQINISPVNYFFANSTTLYVADSGNPKNTSASSSLGDGGLQKWSLISGSWVLDYTLYNGLSLVANSNSSGTCGLYGLAGRVNAASGTVDLYATNYTLADLDQTYLYGITDTLTYTTASQASGEMFTQLDTAPADSNFKGVAFAPAATTTPTASPTPTATVISTPTATESPTATASQTASATPTSTATPTATIAATTTQTATPTETVTTTITATTTETLTPTQTPTESETPTATSTVTSTPTPTCTVSVEASTSIMDFAVAPDDGSFVPTRSVTITNLSSCAAPMSADVEGIDPGEYGLVGDTCHSSLAAAPATCKYTVAFTADGLGEFDADLIVTATGDQNSPYDVTLTGQGSAP